MFTFRKLWVLVACLVVSGLLSTAAAPSAAGASTITYTYSVATRGAIRSDVTEFAARAKATYDDQRGWGLGGSIRFVRVPTGGGFTLWLAEASQLPSFSSVCSSMYSCRVGRDVIINDDRWSYGSPFLAMGLDDYRPMVLNHETGHWLGFGHSTCAGAGQPAYVMQQQSKGGTYLGGCLPNAWPRAEERNALASSRGIAVLPPQPPQPSPAVSGPAVASWSAGRLDLFKRGADNALWHKWFDGASWSGWESLGGVLTSEPAAVSWANNRIDVFVRGTDNALMHKWFDGSWSGWESLGGALSSAPSAASWAPGRLDVFARGTDNALTHKWFDGSWSGWESLGGGLTSDPAAVSWAGNRIDVFVRGTDNAMWHKWWDGAWRGWESLGGALSSAPSAASWAPGRLDVFARGTDNTMWHKWFDGFWSPAGESLGGALTSAPGVVSWGSGRIDTFVRGSDNGLSHKWFDATWRPWGSLGAIP